MLIKSPLIVLFYLIAIYTKKYSIIIELNYTNIKLSSQDMNNSNWNSIKYITFVVKLIIKL